ncbi:hypothetical protein AVEN_41584-1 [Araneus ventricosus]|uniref:Uncharacterized protein n=1 Tax=Araneus ventricosus TaxID=182803 RepID=A0A4Y2GEL0_ARAVE|nr:hypothetical protein AVEN_41584-1 [Araneus ventricosus]
MNTLICFGLLISFGLSLVMDVESISDERPTIVSQHWHVPIPLVPFFHVGNVLMKTFAVLITDLPSVINEEIQVGVQKVDLLLMMIPEDQQSYSRSMSLSGFLRTYCSRKPEIKPTYPQPDPCSFRPCHSLGSLLTLDRTHQKPVFLYF